jgi:hypothetical protein
MHVVRRNDFLVYGQPLSNEISRMLVQ